ncbi:MAG: UDP-N-acetylmuramoyl-L-alanyl-D-glutamate--2,6-diaminopimelate ligase [Eubacteriales bacterium]|nr:UDP-N-acetylmuramoyl-L-alanyl-D-glutamate--2,6-diaminopimelate ligase [Eubacteriales bacterium]
MRNRKVKIEIAGIPVTVTGLYHQSQQVRPGGLYFALKDGTYVAEAVQNGADIIVSEIGADVIVPANVQHIEVANVRATMALAAKNFYGNVVDQMRVTGVVGTNGKTTTTYIMQHILEIATGKNVGVIGTTGVLNAGKTWEGVTTLTTPDPIDLHRAIACMYQNGVRDVVMEVSAHAIHFHKVAGINFAGVIFTNITQDHLDFFETFEKYKNTKIGFFQALQSGAVVINADDAYGLAVADAVNNKPNVYAISYSLKHDTIVGTAQWAFVNQVVLSVRGSDFILGKVGACHLALPGLYNVYNAVAAALLASHYKVDWSMIKEALTTMPAVPGRFNVYNLHGVTAVIDYAHTPDGLEKLLQNARAILPNKAKLFVVFGCGGDRDRLKRPQMGAIAYRLADYVVLTSDNPRTENPERIIDEIERGIKTVDAATLQQVSDVSAVKYTRIADRTQAIEYALSQAQVGDMVVIAGKGHENYMEINHEKIPYMDSKVLDNILRR